MIKIVHEADKNRAAAYDGDKISVKAPIRHPINSGLSTTLWLMKTTAVKALPAN